MSLDDKLNITSSLNPVDPLIFPCFVLGFIREVVAAPVSETHDWADRNVKTHFCSDQILTYETAGKDTLDDETEHVATLVVLSSPEDT